MKAGAAVHVRRMRESDLDRVMAIAASLKDAPHWKREAYLAALDAGRTPHRIALVAEGKAAESLSGFAVASVVTPQAELESIAVAAAAQGQGIGGALLQALAAELRKGGIVEVLLEVRASNGNALGFYRNLGWSETGRRPRYYADPEEDAVLMSWTLG
jgi:[ribosomal protein S18]-alanine N-acetyltransferase